MAANKAFKQANDNGWTRNLGIALDLGIINSIKINTNAVMDAVASKKTIKLHGCCVRLTTST